MRGRSSFKIAAGLVVIAVSTMAGALRTEAARGAGPVVQLVGMSVPSHIASIGCEQSGTIVEMPVADGARIQSGDVLFRLSSRLQQLEVDRLQALVDSDLERDRAAATLQHARKKLERAQELLEREISAQSVAMEVELESELARLSLGKVDFERTQQNNELLQAIERLEQRTLRSPLTGVLSRRFKQLGETVEQLEPVVQVMSLDPLWVQFECPVADEDSFPLGGQVMVRPFIGEHEPRTATIVHVSMQAAVAGHTFLIRASLPNEDYSWRSGLKLKVESVPEPRATPAKGK